MRMLWYDNLTSDEQAEFIQWLQKAGPKLRLALPSDLIDEVIIPVLTDGEGEIGEHLNFVGILAERFDMTNYQLCRRIRYLYNWMTMPLSTPQAAQIIKRPARSLRRLAQRHPGLAEKNQHGHWRWTRQVLVDIAR